jgi:hypothetical protein
MHPRILLSAAAVAGLSLVAVPAFAALPAPAPLAAPTAPAQPVLPAAPAVAADAVAPADRDLDTAEAELSAAVAKLTAVIEAKTARLEAEAVIKNADIDRLVQTAQLHAKAAEIEARRFALSRADIDAIQKNAHEEALAGREAAAEARRIVSELQPQIEAIKREAAHLRDRCRDDKDHCVVLERLDH